MSQLSRLTEQALETVRMLSLDEQDQLAAELMERVEDLLRPPIDLTPGERAELEAGLAAARRGELATDEEVTAMHAKLRL